MNKILTAILFAFSLSLLGCGGGGGGGSTTVATTSDATGVWRGTITENGVGTYTVVGLIYGNQMRFVSMDGGALYEGTITVTGSTFTANTINISMGGGVFSTATLSGSVVSNSSITGTYQASDGATGSFSLTYDVITDRGASLATTDANWVESDGFYTLALAIDSTGAVAGSDTDGCVFNGAVAVQDPAVNIYAIALTVTSCGVADGTYAGYGVVNDTISADDTLTYVVSNDNYIVAGDLMRQ